MNEYVTLARVVKTQGRHGEVAAEVHSDIPDRLHRGLRVFALSDNDSRRELKIEDVWPHKEFLVLKFVGVDSISDAEVLAGSELQVPIGERAEPEPGATFVSDLVGCTVFDRERQVGIVNDVRFGAGEAPLLVVGSGKDEVEVPFAQEFLVRLDPQQKRIEMTLPEGLLDVNAPLTEEEKKQQQRRD